EGHHDAHFGLLHVDVTYRADKLVKRSIDNAHALAGLERHLDLGRFRFHSPHDLVDLFRAERGWLVAHADKARHAGRVAHDVPAIFVHFHLHEDIAGKDAAFHRLAFALADLDFLFRRDDHVENFVLHPHRGDTLLDGVPHLVFVAGIAVDDVPLFFFVNRNLDPFAVLVAADKGSDRACVLAGQRHILFAPLFGARRIFLVALVIQVNGFRIVVHILIFGAVFFCHYFFSHLLLPTPKSPPRRLFKMAAKQPLAEQPHPRRT